MESTTVASVRHLQNESQSVFIYCIYFIFLVKAYLKQVAIEWQSQLFIEKLKQP